MNHRRRTSRRPRGSRSERRGRRAKRAAQALAAAAAIAAGTQAYADPYRYNNPPAGQPGHFDWAVDGGVGSWLDITLHPGSQPGQAGGPASFEQWVYPGGGGYGAVAGIAGVTSLQVSGDMLLPSGSGEVVPDGSPFDHFGYSVFDGASLLPEGLVTYLGVRFNGPDWHYGWIAMIREGVELDALGWGYETEPGVPIGVGVPFPEPGTLAMLALGAGAVAARRRRRTGD